MKRFTQPLRAEFLGNNLWKTIDPFEYHVGKYPSDEIIIVPEGFITNFASVPRIFWPIISPIDNHAKAAILHDYCYFIGYKDSRKYCDDIFREAMIVLKVNKIKVFLMYWSVRLFSGLLGCWKANLFNNVR
jgi:hypothetical protein